MRRVGVLSGAAIGLVIFVTTLRARAQSSVPIRLDYVAPGSCPDRGAFASQLATRTRRLQIVSGDTRAQVLTVRVGPRGTRFVGHLTIGDSGGGASERDVEGRSCAEVVTALALIGALVLDPSSNEDAKDDAKDHAGDDPKDQAVNGTSGKPGGENGSDPARAGTKPEDSSPKGNEAKGDKAKGNEAKGNEDRNHEDKGREDEGDHAKDAGRWQLSFGAQGEIAFGIAPKILGSVPVFVELARRSEQRIVSPSARLRFERSGTDADATAQGSAHFTWTEASLDVCPIALWPTHRWRVQPCLRGEVGVVDGTGVGTPLSNEKTRPWLDFAAVAGSRWEIVGPLFVEIEAALVVPVVRDRFFIDPANTTVFLSSPAGASFAGGAGVSIW